MKIEDLLPIVSMGSILAGARCSLPLRAYVYRGPAACEGCPEAVGALLESSPTRINVTYVGPDEAIDISVESLSRADIYAQPGGGDLALAWKDMKKYKSAIRDFVRSGGRYLGFCLGAYVAGHDPGFDLLDSEDDCDQEITQPGSQVHNERDTVIQVDWAFSSGLKDGKTDCRRWLYFQDGAVVKLSSNSTARVLAKYSGDGDVAATVSAFGKGWVGLVGPHPEADQSWYEDAEISNPDGVHFDIGHDFVEATINTISQPS